MNDSNPDIEPRHPTLTAYLSEYSESDYDHATEAQLDEAEMHAENLESALVNLYRGPLGHDTIHALLAGIFDNARDIAADAIFDDECRTYRNLEA